MIDPENRTMCKGDENALGQAIDCYLGSTTGVVRQKYTYTQVENFRLTGLQGGVSPNYNTLQNVSYSYDDQGNVLTVVDAAAFGGSQTQTFSYDALNRLLSAQAAGGSNGTYSQRSYVYTSAGNISTFEGAALGYNDAGHKHAVTHVAGVQRYWYDQNGNATRRVNGSQDVTLAYDAENHVTSSRQRRQRHLRLRWRWEARQSHRGWRHHNLPFDFAQGRHRQLLRA